MRFYIYFVITIMFTMSALNIQAQRQTRTLTIQPAADNDQVQRCNADQLHNALYASSPEYRASFNAKKEVISAIPTNARLTCDNPIIVPVAVHYEGVSTQTLECLTDLALSQIAVLNADYSSSNTDVTDYCADAAGSGLDGNAIAGNGACVQFCLADQNHPAGFGLTNGDYAVTINENYVANGSFPNFTDGAWAGYFNIFVTEGTGVLGYSPLFGDAIGDGIVIEACAFGVQGSGCGLGIGPGSGCSGFGVYNLGRTATHEAGHYFGLPHVWGNGAESGQCGADDGFDDTPNCEGSTYGCPSSVQSSCGTADMTMNFMDYVNDACMYMFTEEQATTIHNWAATLWSTTSTKCSTTPSYPVSLVPGGCSPDALEADFSFEVPVECPALTANFTNESRNETSWSWDFGDGVGTSMNENPSYTYSSPGTYTVTLTVGDGVETNMTSQDVTVPGAEVYNNLNNGTLVAIGSDGWGYIGGHNNYGDIAKAERFEASQISVGSLVTGASFVFISAGGNPSSNVKFNIWSNDGTSGFPGTILSTTNLMISELNVGGVTVVDFPDITTTGPIYIGFELNYLGVSTTEDAIAVATNSDGETVPTTAYEQWSDNDWWSFNDGTGTQNTWELDVALAITAIVQCDGVVVGDPPVADFSADATTVCEGTSVSFTDESTEDPTDWVWDFGDGGMSTMQNPSYTYNSAGTYTVTLTATNSSGFDDEVKTNYITVQAAPTGFAGQATETEVCAGTSVDLSMTGTFGGAYSWETSTGTNVSNSSTATVTPGSTTTYTAICDDGVCYAEDDVTITVNALPVVTVSNSSGTLTASSSSSGAIQWYKDDVLISGASGTTYVATEDGDYYAVLTDGDGCVGESNEVAVVLTAVLDDILDASIVLYPNPVKESLQVEFNGTEYQDLVLSIVDLSGRTLQEMEISAPYLEIDMRSYSTGVYMFTFETEDGRKAIKKVVKQD